MALWLRALGGVGLGPHVLLALINESIKWWAHQDLNLGPIDYEDGGEPVWTLLRGRIVKSFLDANLRFEAVRTYTEPRLNLRPT